MRPVVHFAPLQGYTDAIYREAHAQVFGGVESYYTPFIRIEKDGFRNKDLRDIAHRENQSIQVIPQLIAAIPDEFRRIASLFYQYGYRRADINLGCPFPMQVRLHRGAGILPYPHDVETLLNVIPEFPELKFSVKLRLGWNVAEEIQAIVPILNSHPLVHVTLHPRIGIQQYKGIVDLDGFSRFYESCSHPLFYNGDLNTLADIYAITGQFPRLRGIMLGRGLLAAPWLAMEYQAGKELSDREKKSKLRAFHALLAEEYGKSLEGGDHQILARMKTLWDYMLPDVDKKLHKKVIKSKTLLEYKDAVRNLIDNTIF